MWTSIIFSITFGLICYRLYQKISARNYPPGPPGLPIIGNAAQMRPRQFVALSEFGKTFGDVFTIKLFSRRFVVLNTYKAIKSAFIDNGNIFALRPRLRGDDSLKRQKGIVLSDGPHWRAHRRFALKTLKDFGFSKTIMVDALHIELQTIIDVLEEGKGRPMLTSITFAKLTTNIICRLVFGDRFTDDETAHKDNLLKNMIFALQTTGSLRYNLINFFPFLASIPLFVTIYNKLNYRSRCIGATTNFIKNKIQEHSETIQRLSEPRDYIDVLLLHTIALNENKSDHFFDVDSMTMNIYDLFVAGTDTTAVTLTWGMLLMAVHPEIQEKTRSEIHETLGRQSLPIMQDMSKLNYTLAVIDEITRFGSIAPSAIFHRTADDVIICDQLIPKDTSIMPNLYAVHHDPHLWLFPDSFNPLNFLDEDGCYKTSENLIPFSLGKRSCPGESLARMEIFVFFVGILQRFWVTLANCDSVDLENILIGHDGVTRHSADHEIIFKENR